MSDETRNKLISALRQFRHNNDNTGPIASPEQGFVFAYDRDETEGLVASLEKKLEQAEARADACQQQAQIWKQEAGTQSAIVAEIYQELTGKTGEPGDWNGGRPLRAEILRKQAEKLDEIAAHIKEAAEAGLSSVASIYEGLKLNSSSLRQQADEIESGGGDE